MESFKIWWSEVSPNLLKRVKSFAWHLLCYMLVAGAARITQQVSGWNLPDITLLGGITISTKVIISLGLAQVTKWLNNHTELFGVRLK